MAEYTNHETDDHGFPMCRCEACREKSKIINAQYVAQFIGSLGGPMPRGHDEQAEWNDRAQDYPRKEFQ